jgi:tagaturonate reductase
MQYSSKMQMRNIPTIINYYEKVGSVPEYMALGFAAHILFMRSEKDGLNKFWGEVNGRKYLINDDNAAYYAEVWKQFSTIELVQKLLSNTEHWGTDLSALPGFAEAVNKNLNGLLSEGAATMLTRAKEIMVAA